MVMWEESMGAVLVLVFFNIKSKPCLAATGNAWAPLIQKKAKTHVDRQEQFTPKSFVIRRGHVEPSIKALESDLR